ncbi:hypothetical protein PI125_g8728 [Phytophthora idaei]|nr:hypothetical protein PI125_g8728 [Phytophthora idaei]KAG3159943.1 hypothetical protein PI126_g7134 [Phytophthora idaei]
MKASASMRQARALAVLIAVTLLVACEASSNVQDCIAHQPSPAASEDSPHNQ